MHGGEGGGRQLFAKLPNVFFFFLLQDFRPLNFNINFSFSYSLSFVLFHNLNRAQCECI